MDGYAVRAADTTGATDAVARDAARHRRARGRLRLPTARSDPATAVRIMTGAPIPPGADAVVPFEETDEPAGRIVRRRSPSRRESVGILKAAGPARTSAAPARTSAGASRSSRARHRARTRRRSACSRRSAWRPSASTAGPSSPSSRPATRCVEPGQPLAPGQIYDSNTYSISAMVTRERRHPAAPRHRPRHRRRR